MPGILLTATPAALAVDDSYWAAIFPDDWNYAGNWIDASNPSVSLPPSSATPLTVIAYGASRIQPGDNLATGANFSIGADVGGGTSGTLQFMGGGSLTSGHVNLGADAGTTGTVLMNGGTWTTTDDMGLGLSGTGTLTLSGGGTLSVGHYGIFIGYNSGSTGTLNIGAYDLASPTTGGTLSTPSGGIILGTNGSTAAINFNQTDTFTLGSGLSGAGILTQRGSGTTVYTGNGSAFTGITIVSAGTLQIGGSGSLPGTITVAGSGTIAYNRPGDFTLDSTVSIFLSTSGSKFAKLGANTLTLTTAITGSNGSVQVNGGTLRINNGGSIAGNASVASNATLAFNRSDNVIYSGTISGDGAVVQSGAGTLTLSGANTYTGGTTISAGTLALGGSNVLPNTGTLTVAGGTLSMGPFNDTVGAVTLTDGSIDGSGTLTATSSLDLRSGTINAHLGSTASLAKSGAGTVTINNTGAYTGGTSVSEGTPRLGINNALPTAGDVVVTGGTLDLNGFSQTVNTLLLSGGSVSVRSGGQMTASSYQLVSGTITGPLAGSATLTKTLAGTATLNGANTYTGGTTISAGTLALGGSNVLPNTGTLTVAGGTLSMGPFNDTVGAVTLTDGSIDGSGTLTATSSFDLRSGTVNVHLAGGSLVKSGAGAVVINSSGNFYASTTISGGVLVASGTALGTGPVTLDGGALSIGAPGTIASLSAASLSMSGGELRFDMSFDSGSWTFDNLTLSGDLTLGGTLHLTLLGGYTPALGDSFNLFNWDGELSGSFASLDLPVLGDGLAWDTGTLYTNGTLTVVPEPATLALLLLGATLAILRIWRQRVPEEKAARQP